MVFPASQVSRKIRISSMEETANKVLKRVRIFICPNTVQKKEQNIYAWKKKSFSIQSRRLSRVPLWM